MSWSKAQLLKMKRNIHMAVVSLDDETATETPELFPVWEVGKAYEQDDRIQYAEKLYKVLQAHTSQADWPPDTAVSLYAEVAKPGEIPVWKQPTGAQDAYMEGDLVHYPDKNGPVYRSNYDNNVWAPDAFGWTLYEG